MSRQFAQSTGWVISLGSAATIVVALKVSSALAACVLPSGSTPGSCPYSGSGPALTITDSASSAAPAASTTFRGIATGTRGQGILGEATGTNGIGGLFQAAAPSTTTTATTALQAVNSGGSTSAEGNYGNAGVFTITNAKNQSPGVSIATNGINSYGLSVVNTGTTDGSVNYGPPFDIGDIAGYFAITNGNSSDSTAIYAVSSGGGGSAATFITSDPANTDDTLYAQTFAPNGTGVYASVGGKGGDGSGVEGDDQTSGGGNGVWGNSAHGFSGTFTGGSGGTNTCTYNGSSSGWSCNAALTMMDDRTAPNYAELLDRLDGMPMAYFHTHGAKKPVRELGMSAEDFRAAFGLGPDDKTIAEGNTNGVALAAAKGLYRKLKADEATIAAQNARIAAQNARIAALEAQAASAQAVTDRLARLEATMARLAPSAAANTRQAMLAK